MPGQGRRGMGDVTPSTIIQAAVALLVALIGGWMLRANTRINAYLQRKDREAQEEEQAEQAERAARLASDTAKEQRLSQDMRDILDRYKADLEQLRQEMRQMRADHQAEMDALRAEHQREMDALRTEHARRFAVLQADHDRVLTENQAMRARLAELERRQNGGTA